ncbi:hypothetical protein [Streptomyces sp. DH37]|uniref:hypothetical protein n=1 Tax=Streptomyces sp. DH37 TaxID=3040122 RepID=UPI0024434370|nr:hypothetical protein [Streptomyces sp. DH37]MDG9706262.1 hypothetical protein [Streptomyces sp. DH37]
MTNVNDIVAERIAAAEQRRTRRRQQRAELAEAREKGLAARQAAKLARPGPAERDGARIALAALRRDYRGVAELLNTLHAQDSRRAAATAIAALAELALTSRPYSVRRTRERLAAVAHREAA